MITIEKLEINTFKNIEKFKGEFGDLNILIGPNNIGKSNVLNVINRLYNMECGQSGGFSCDYCNKIKNNLSKDIFGGIEFEITESDRHRKIDDPTLTCTFNKGLVMYYWLRLNKNRLKIPEIFSHIQQADKNISSNADVQQALKGGLLSFINYLKSNKLEDTLFAIFEGYYIKRLSNQLSEDELKEHLEKEVKNNLLTINPVYERDRPISHISILSEIQRSRSIISEIIDKDKVLLCSDLRVNEYNGKPLSKYILEKGHTNEILKRFLNFINRIVDPPIHDIRFPDKGSNSTLAFLFDGFEDSIENQGSGTRSLIGLAWDIITMKEGSIIIIDEPELGLHPSAKQELLKLLLEEAETKQIFIATHDPTFVNPVIWQEFIRKKDLKMFSVNVLLYSFYTQSFKNVDLDQSKEDPETFAGYLPHTTSLKESHIYVEGPSDVYVFQIWLEKYLKEKYERNWLEVFNEIGIYHLAGDNWVHLLYTLPMGPYKCIVIFDGDKALKARDKPTLEDVCKKYNEAQKFENVSKIKSYKDVREINFNSDHHPIYCLKRKEIEYYYDPALLAVCIIDQNKVESVQKDINTIERLRDECDRLLFSLKNKDSNVYEQGNRSLVIDINLKYAEIVDNKEHKTCLKLSETGEGLKITDLDLKSEVKKTCAILVSERTAIPPEIESIFDVFVGVK